NDGDLGPCVDNRRDRLVVHVRRLPGDHFGGDDALLLGLVREHRPGYAIPDCEHVRQVGPHLVIDEDLAFSPELQAERRRVDPDERRSPAEGDEHVIAAEVFLRAILLDVEEDPIAVAEAGDDAGAGAEVEALTAEDAVTLLHEVVIHPRQDGGHELDDGDFGAEASPDGAELETDDATANDDEVPGNARD